MRKLIRHTQKRGTALFVALSLTALTLGLLPFVGGPQQQSSRTGGTPADTQVSAPVAGGADAGISSAQDKTQTAQPLTAAQKSALRKSAHSAKKLYEPLASQVFNLATSRAAAAHNSELPNGATLTTDRDDYPPLSYVYFTGTGFEPGETVQMIVVETDPIQQSFEPWEVVADENGNFETSWYIFSKEFNGAKFQATATGQKSGLTASCTFTDANGDGTMTVSPGSKTPSSTGNNFTFSFRNEAAAFVAGAYATVVVPTSWTTNGGTAPTLGNVSVTPVGTATASIASVVGNTITINFTAAAGSPNGFDLSFSGVTTPSTVGTHTFATATKTNAGGTPTAILSSPSIIVSPTIQQRGSATLGFTAGANAATVVVNKPTGVVSGDVLIANIGLRSGTQPSYPTSPGWTLIASTTFEGNSNHRTASFYKVAGGSEPVNYTFTINPPNASATMEGAIVAFSGVDTSVVFDVAPGTYSTNTGNSQITGVTSITTVTANAAVVMLAAANEGTQITSFLTATSPGALGELYGDTVNTSSAVGAGWSIRATAGSTGAGSATNTSASRWGSILIALRPFTCTLTASSSAPAILCNGGTAVVTVSASGGTAPYTGTGTFTRSAGTYSFTVTDANSCTATTAVTVTQPATALVASSSAPAILCNGGTAVVTVSATGGTPGYTGTGTFTRSAGTYSFTVTDANSCTATTAVTVTQPATALVASSSAPAILCNGGTAVVTVSATGGTPGYTGTGTFTRSAGTYSFTVTDANSCTATTAVTVTQPATALVASSSAPAILCNGGTAVVTVSATGGTPGYTGTGTFTRSAGTYSFTVTDANSCTATTAVTVTEPATALVASSSAPAILCNGGTAVVTVSATGGTPGYTGTGTFTRSAGTYSFTVTDANSCTATTAVTVTEPATALVASSSAPAILCNGGTAVVTVSATGGTPGYTGTGTFTRSAGTYSFTVTDANSCTATTAVTVTEPSALVAQSTNTGILCNGGSTTVSVSAIGGSPPYTGTGTFTRSAGTYSFTVTDANSCTETTMGNIPEPSALVPTSTAPAILCNGGTAVVTVSASGGTPGYTGTGTFTRSAGTYSFTVTDANSCTATTAVTVTQPTALTLSLSVTACSSGSNGSIQATFGGGTGPYQVHIDFVPSATQTSPYTFTGLTPGPHTITVTDANGCTKSDSITVPTCAINGSISIRGGARLDTTNCNTAKKVMSWLNGAGAMPTVASRSGSFATYVNVGDSVTMAVLPWTFGSGLNGLWSVGGFTFNLTSSTKTYNLNGFLVVSGPGTITRTGFDPTPGTWTFSTQNPAANGIFSFSASTTAQ